MTFSMVISGPAPRASAINPMIFCEQQQIFYGGCTDPCTPGNSPGMVPSGTLDDTADQQYATTPGVNKHYLILVHTTEGDSLAGATGALLSKGYSYHTIIEKSGVEVRLLPDDVNAIGAGGANLNSLHATLVGRVGESKGAHFDPNSPQLQTLSKRIGEWASKYNIPLEKVSGPGLLDGSTKGVAGHIDVSAVSASSDGHTDPGENFPWGPVLANARASMGGSALGNSIGRSPATDTTNTGSTSPSNKNVCCPATGSGPSAQTTGDGGGCGEKADGSQANEAQVWSYFMNKFTGAGYNKDEAEKATAGIMGNWQQESGFNPDKHNSAGKGAGCTGNAGPITGTVGMGIAQWCGDRQQKLVDFAAGEDPSCLGVQLEFAWSEMQDRKLVEGMKGVSASEAASIFNLGGNGAQGFEIGYDNEGRMTKAGEQYTKYTGKDAGTLSARSASSCQSNSSTPASGSVAEAAKQAGEKGGCYDAAGGHGSLDDLKERIDKGFGPGFGVDCSGFVRAMLFVGTGVDPGSFTTGTLMTVPENFTEITDRCSAKPGDIAVTNDHTEIITEVNADCTFKTVGAHTTGCAPENGIYPAAFQGDKVLRYNPGAAQI